LFGLSNFSIRLPSIILAVTAGLLIFGGIKNLTKTNIAVISSLIVTSSVFFLDFARVGAPMIMSIFLFSLTIFAVTQYALHPKPKSIWLVWAVAAMALGLYSPLGIYFLAGCAIFGILHPKGRLLLSRLKLWQKIIMPVLLVVAITPIVTAMVSNPNLVPELLGLNHLKIMPGDVWYNLQSLIMPWSVFQNGLVTPLINFVELVLMVIGVIALLKNRQSARSYIILGLGLITLLLSILDVTKSYLLFLPAAFLMAFGIQAIIERWYSIFPLNPYARFTGLVPIFIFVCGLVLTNHAHFSDSLIYDKNVVYDRNEILLTAKSEINKLSAHQINLAADESEVSLYKLLEWEYPNLTVGTKFDIKADTNILIPSTFDLNKNIPDLVKTSGNSQDDVLLKVYQKSNR
jgi:4-amino-4-deoxy-L-arabinose transferase-like glycosyltransferase